MELKELMLWTFTTKTEPTPEIMRLLTEGDSVLRLLKLVILLLT